jgi:hypothetical protein
VSMRLPREPAPNKSGRYADNSSAMLTLSNNNIFSRPG